jgi:hypothetical protein
MGSGRTVDGSGACTTEGKGEIVNKSRGETQLLKKKEKMIINRKINDRLMSEKASGATYRGKAQVFLLESSACSSHHHSLPVLVVHITGSALATTHVSVGNSFSGATIRTKER